MSKISLCDGKYTVTHDNGNNLQAFRNGEPWRNLVGDNLVLALVQRIEELEYELGLVRQSQYRRFSGDWDD